MDFFRAPIVRLGTIVLFILVVSLACNFGSPAETPDIPGARTQIAGTMTALSTVAGDQSVETGAPTTATEPPTLPATLSPFPPNLRVVYTKDGNVWSWQEGRAPSALTTAGQVFGVQLTEDGAIAAFFRQVDEIRAELWAVGLDGSEERQLVSIADLTDMDPGALAVAPNR